MSRAVMDIDVDGPYRRVVKRYDKDSGVIQCKCCAEFICSKCGEPFDQFLPGQVARSAWFGLRSKVFAVICRACKEIVGYE